MNNDHLKTIAMFEQAGAFLNVFATFLYSYHNSLCEAGFQRSEALVLVKKLQTTMFTEAFNSGSPRLPDEDIDNI
jgi:hypothetical protein